MIGIPRPGPEPGEPEVLTGISCPDCPGVLGVSMEGERLRFRCRIGHLYSLTELIESKEQRLENVLWSPVTALDELATILTDAVESGGAGPLATEYQQRAERARRLSAMVREIIDQNTPVTLYSRAPTSEEG